MEKILLGTARMAAFLVLYPIVLIAIMLGFRRCWQCNKMEHILFMRKYDVGFFKDKPKVCKNCCHELNKRRWQNG